MKKRLTTKSTEASCNLFKGSGKVLLLFRTSNIETVKVSQSFFGISLPSVVLRSRTDEFEQKFSLRADLVKALV